MLGIMICNGIAVSWLSAWPRAFCSCTDVNSGGGAVAGFSVGFSCACGNAVPLDWPAREGKPPGRREAGNHVLGLRTVNHPADPTLKPLRVTERRIFMASF